MSYGLSLLFAILCFIALIAYPVAAQTSVEADGMAKIGPDISMSRDLAILRAEQNALESLGVGIKAKDISVQGRLLDDVIIVQTKGFVDSFRVLREEKQDGYYRVHLKAVVKEGKALKDAYRSLFRKRTLWVCGTGPGSELVEDRLRKGLTKRFYYVLGEVQKATKPDYRIEVRSSVGPYSDLGMFKSFHACVHIKMTQTTSPGREVLFVGDDNPILIYGKDLNQALTGNTVNQYPEKIATPLTALFWRRLKAFENGWSRNIVINISRLPNVETFNRFRDYVRHIRLGMGGLLTDRYADGNGALEVSYREKSMYLAAIIGYRRQYRVVDYNWDHIRVAYAGE